MYSCNDVPVVAPYSLLSLRQLSKATLVSHSFHNIQSPVLAHHSSAVSQRKPNQLRNTHSKCRHSRLGPEKSEGLSNSLGSTLVGRLPACVRLLISLMSLPTIQRFWAHNPVKQSVTLFFLRLKACGMCMQCISVHDDQPTQRLLLKANSRNVHCATH